MLVKARIKLNIKRLYAADALAVKELLKMAMLLHKATRSKSDFNEVQHDDLPCSASTVQIDECMFDDCLSDFTCRLQDDMAGTLDAVQLPDAKSSRTLGSEIMQAGMAVYDALQKEPELRELRHRCTHTTCHAWFC